MWSFRSDRRRLPMAGVHSRGVGQAEQRVVDRVDDRGEIGQRPAREAGAAGEQGVAREDVPPARRLIPPGV